MSPQPPRRARRSGIRCGACGRPLRPTHRFCPHCGTPVVAERQAQAPPSQLAPAGPSLQVAPNPSVDLSENRRLVTILFADLSGSTLLGERLDPEDLRRILTEYFGALSREIQRFGGTVDKYIGDAVMAVFGAPLAHEDDGERAINAALAMQDSIGRLNDDLERRYNRRLSLRIGINTGEVVAGLLAGDVQSAYTVVGDAVNTAQRFESAAPPGGVLVSQSTWQLTRRTFRFEPIKPLVLKGKSEPQSAYRVTGLRQQEVELAATPLVGRAEDLAQLQRAIDSALQGNGQSIHIAGEAGVGKSRLVREFRASVHPLVLQFVSRCASFEVDAPYTLIARLLRFAFRIDPGTDESAAETSLTVGFEAVGQSLDSMETVLLLYVLGYNRHSSFDPESQQRVLLNLVRRYMAANSELAPLLIIAEDLHWADSGSVALFRELVRDLAGRRCLLLTTARPNWSPPWSTELLTLEALPETGARELVETVFGAPVEDSLLDMILSRTGGNPFFVEEVVHGLWESDVLVDRDGRIGVQVDAAPRVPATVQEVLIARLDRLPPSAKRVLQPAAVYGRVFPLRVLENLLPDRQLGESLATLEREAFILAQTVCPEPIYLFRHALIQEVAYQNQLQSQRRVTHSAIGEAIETLYSERLDEFISELAFHYGRSDNDAKAVAWLVRAADRARSLFANHEALTQYAAALERAPEGEGALEAGSILERMGDVQTLIGRYDEAIASFQSSMQRSGAASAARLARLHRKIGMALLVKAEFDQALVQFDTGLKQLEGTRSLEAACIGLQVGELHRRRGNDAAAEQVLSEALDIATSFDAQDVVADILKQLGIIPYLSGDPRQAISFFERSRVIYERAENITSLADVRINLGGTYVRLARWEDALAEFQAALRLHERTGNRWRVGLVHNNMGEVYRAVGDPYAAVQEFEEAISIWSEIGHQSGVALALTGLGAARVELGDVSQGRTDLERAEVAFQALGSTKYFPDLYRFLASAELASGDLDAAERAAARSTEFARSANVPHQAAATQRVQAQIALARGDRRRAHELLENSRRTLSDVGDALELQRTEAVLESIASDDGS